MHPIQVNKQRAKSRRIHDRVCLPALLAVLASAGCAVATDASESVDQATEPIQAGQLESGYPSVGWVTSSAGNCSGTLIAPYLVLTAAHCSGTGMKFSSDEIPGMLSYHSADSQVLHPSMDLMLMHLSQPVWTIGTTPINLNAIPSVGTTCTAVGWGNHVDANGAETLGVKRSCTEIIESADTSNIVVRMVSGIADHGDSGGPLLCNGGSVAGVVRNHTDGDWPQHIRENYTTVDANWITGKYAYQMFIQQTRSALAKAEDGNGDFAMSDVNRDAIPDLVYIKRRNTGSGKIELHSLGGSYNYRVYLQHVATALPQAESANGSFLLSDLDRDGTPDLVFVKRRNTGSGRIEIHVLSASSNYQSYRLQVATALSQGEDGSGDFLMSDVDRDGIPDLVYVKRRNVSKIEVHVLAGWSNYQSFIQHVATPLVQAEDGNGSFVMSDVDRDGTPDLVFVKQRSVGSGGVEAHVLSGSSGYQRYAQQVASAVRQADSANGDFTMADVDRDGYPDLVFIKRRNVGSSTIEVHTLRAAVSG